MCRGRRTHGRRPRCTSPLQGRVILKYVIALLVPLAHVGHWLWVLYLPPILIVAGSILRSTFSERRRKRDD
jgi:hypothetical protein